MSELSRPAGRLVKWTQGAGLQEVPRSIVCGVAGTFTGEDAYGNTVTNYPLQQGYNPIRPRKWTGGAATDVWGLYD